MSSWLWVSAACFRSSEAHRLLCCRRLHPLRAQAAPCPAGHDQLFIRTQRQHGDAGIVRRHRPIAAARSIFYGIDANAEEAEAAAAFFTEARGVFSDPTGER